MDPPRKKMKSDTSDGGAEANESPETPNSLQMDSTSSTSTMKSNPTAAISSSHSSPANLHHVHGDLLAHDADYIVHQCNCRTTRAMGLACSLFCSFPHADTYNPKLAPMPPKRVPGTLTLHGGPGTGLRGVINLYGQDAPGKTAETKAQRLTWFQNALQQLADVPNLNSVAFPHGIGCGLAGGSWTQYEAALGAFAVLTPKTEVYIVQMQTTALKGQLKRSKAVGRGHSTTTTTSRHNDVPATISNKTLGDLRREREERAVTKGRQSQLNKTRDTSPNLKGKSDPNKSVTIDLTSDNDEDDDDYAASVALAKKLSQPPSSSTSAASEAASEAASLALARSLSQHHPSAASSSSSDEAASLALARSLSQQLQPLISPSLPQNALYAHLKSDADNHRRSCEGPPTAPWTTITSFDGTQQRLKRSPHGWRENYPVVACTDLEILAQLQDLGSPPPPNGITTNKSNATLIRLLCSWRKHVVSTKLETKPPGATRFTSCSICTSEQTWLGRKTEKGGIIGVVAATTSTVDTLLAILNLKDEGAKATNAGESIELGL